MEQLGKYTLIERIGVGGMAEVWLARASGPGGFAKSCVVKMVRPGVDQARFTRMFIDEARLAALLNHPNIVQIFDFGEESGKLFIAMEFIQGRTLRALMRKTTDKGIRLPLEHSARILSGVLQGLEHAHSLTDQTGQPLNVIHRDVSPENIMVGYSGAPKLVDFGIAKAVLSTDRTRDGRAKGKLTYMAPEQLLGQPLDHRVDLYAAGVVLYELACGRHPFPIQQPEALARAIIDDEAVHPQKIDPSLPDELSDIITRCLEKDPERRFPSARALFAELDTFIQTLTVGNNVPRLDQFVSTLWAEEMAEDAARARKAAGAAAVSHVNPPHAGMQSLLGEEKDTVSEAAPPRAASPSSSRLPANVPSTPPARVNASPSSSRMSMPPGNGAHRSHAPARAESPSNIAMPPLAVATGESPLTTTDRNALANVFATDDATVKAPSSSSTPIAAPALSPPPAIIEQPSSPDVLGFQATGMVLRGTVWRVPRQIAVTSLVSAAVAAAAIVGAVLYVVGVRTGQQRGAGNIARISVPMAGCRVSVDGKALGSSPLQRVEVMPGDHIVELTCGDSSFRSDVVLVPGQEWAVIAAVPAEASAVDGEDGFISLTGRKPGTLFVDGKNVGDIPASALAVRPGAHELRFVGKDRKEQRMKVDVTPGRTVTLRFP